MILGESATRQKKSPRLFLEMKTNDGLSPRGDRRMHLEERWMQRAHPHPPLRFFFFFSDGALPFSFPPLQKNAILAKCIKERKKEA